MAIPIITFNYFPNQDGPAHVNSAAILFRISQSDQFIERYFYNGGLSITNWANTWIFTKCIWFISSTLLERVFVISYLVLFTGATTICTRMLCDTRSLSTIIFLPIAFTHMLHMGSFNLSLACLLFLPLLSVCNAYLYKPSLRLSTVTSVLLIGIFVLHVQVAVLGLICVAIYVGWILIISVAKTMGRTPTVLSSATGMDVRYRHAFELAVACIPVTAMCLAFATHNSAALASRPQYIGLIMKFVHLGFLSGVASYSLFGLAVTGLLFLIIFLAAIRVSYYIITEKCIEPADCLLVCALAILFVFFVLPNGLGDAFNIEERVMIPFLLALLAWIVTRWRVSNVMIASCVVIISLQALDRFIAFENINVNLAEYEQVRPYLPDGDALIVVNPDQFAPAPIRRRLAQPFATQTRFDPYRAFMGDVVAERDIALISNYEASSIRPYFAPKYQDWLSQVVGDANFDALAAGQVAGDTFDRQVARLRSGRFPVSYLAIWALRPESLQLSQTRSFLQIVRRNYDLVFRSSNGHLSLYKLKQSAEG